MRRVNEATVADVEADIPTRVAWDKLRKAALRYAESERRRGRPEEEE